MVTASKSDTKADVTSIKYQLQYAEEGRLVQSWLSNALTRTNSSPAGATELNDEGAEEDINDEFDFEQDEEGLGLGYVAPTTPNMPKDRQSMSTNDQLRKQLLGRSRPVHQRPLPGRPLSSDKGGSGGGGHGRGKLSASKPKPKLQPRIQQGRSADESDDDSDGRTAATTKTKTKTQTLAKVKTRSREDEKNKSTSAAAGTESVSSGISTNPGSTGTASHEHNSGNRDGTRHTKTAKRRSTNYLDEILAQRKTKKLKKGQRQQ